MSLGSVYVAASVLDVAAVVVFHHILERAQCRHPVDGGDAVLVLLRAGVGSGLDVDVITAFESPHQL